MKKENISIIISILSLFVAIVAVWLPFHQNESKSKEIISINVELDKSNNIHYLNKNVLQFPFIVTISNNSFIPLSLMKYDFYQFDYNREAYTFDGLTGNVLPIDNKVVKFPIFLKSGESIQFKVLVGNRISLNNKEILNDSIETLEKKKLLDIPNFVRLDEQSDNIPLYLMRVTTSKNNYFYGQFVIGSIYTPLLEEDIEKFSSQFGVRYIDLTDQNQISQNSSKLFKVK